MDNNIWAELGLVFLGGLIGFGGGVIAPRLSNDFFGPKLDVSITDDEECNTTTTLSDPETGQFFADARYVRVKVTNIGNSTAKNCAAYLSGVEFLDAEIDPKARYVDTIRLSWSGRSTHAAIDLPPNISDYVNVLEAHSKSNFLRPLLEVNLNRYVPLWQQKGRIKLTVSVSADDTKVAKFPFEVDWHGHWENLRGRPVP